MIIVTVARRPLPNGTTVAASVLQDGTGALDIDSTRVSCADEVVSNHGRKSTENGWDPRWSGAQAPHQTRGQQLGRWPANLVLGHLPVCQEGACVSGCPVASLDQQAGHLVSGKPTGTKRGDKRDEDAYGDMNARFGGVPVTGYGDEGGASRFFKRV